MLPFLSQNLCIELLSPVTEVRRWSREIERQGPTRSTTIAIFTALHAISPSKARPPFFPLFLLQIWVIMITKPQNQLWTEPFFHLARVVNTLIDLQIDDNLQISTLAHIIKNTILTLKDNNNIRFAPPTDMQQKLVFAFLLSTKSKKRSSGAVLLLSLPLISSQV